MEKKEDNEEELLQNNKNAENVIDKANTNNNTTTMVTKQKKLKIITIEGDSNRGKTTIVWAVYNKLIHEGGESTYFQIEGVDAKDFHAIIIWEGAIIALCSIGDNAKSDEEDEWAFIGTGIENALKHNADILINVLSLDQNLSQNGYKILLKKLTQSEVYEHISVIKMDSIEEQIKQKQNKVNEILQKI